LVEGASEGCRPKLPRWPFSASGCTQVLGTAVHGSMVGSHARRVKLFCAAPRIFGAPRAARLVVAVFPPASFLMHLALAHGPMVFLARKSSLTGAGVWVLAAHQRWPRAVRGLHGLALGYGAVLASPRMFCFLLVSQQTAGMGKGTSCAEQGTTPA